MHPSLAAQGLGPLLLQPKSQGLSFSASQIESFAVFANFSCFLSFFCPFFLFFYLSATGLSSLHHEVNFSWVVTRGFAACRPRQTTLYQTPHLLGLEGLGL